MQIHYHSPGRLFLNRSSSPPKFSFIYLKYFIFNQQVAHLKIWAPNWSALKPGRCFAIPESVWEDHLKKKNWRNGNAGKQVLVLNKSIAKSSLSQFKSVEDAKKIAHKQTNNPISINYDAPFSTRTGWLDLLAFPTFQVKMRIEVDEDLLLWIRRLDQPGALLVHRVSSGVFRRSHIPSLGDCDFPTTGSF